MTVPPAGRERRPTFPSGRRSALPPPCAWPLRRRYPSRSARWNPGRPIDVGDRPGVGGDGGDVGAARPGRALPELAGLRVGPLLRQVEPLGICHPRRAAGRDRVRPRSRARCCRAGRPRSAARRPCCQSQGSCAGSRPPAPPEKTLMIVTAWPSSRRLATRPPQESAMSSGWAPTKTWVMCRKPNWVKPLATSWGWPTETPERPR